MSVALSETTDRLLLLANGNVNSAQRIYILVAALNNQATEVIFKPGNGREITQPLGPL